MAGLDVYSDIFSILERGLGSSFSAPLALVERVEQGKYGVKSSGGFYETPADGARLVEKRDRAYAALLRIRSELEE
jgi:3-hydroxyacyl-CoA dehydrogenase